MFDEKMEMGNLLRGGKDYEFRIPIQKVTPLQPCRGKAGGMNHAMDILDEYFVKHNKFLRADKHQGNVSHLQQSFYSAMHSHN